jgi:hypothetical protein
MICVIAIQPQAGEACLPVYLPDGQAKSEKQTANNE